MLTNYQLAQKAHQKGDLVAAEQYYIQTLHQSPRFAEAYHYLGLVRSQQGRKAEGIADLQQAIRLNPVQPHYYNNLGLMFAQSAEWANALQCYQMATKLAPKFAEANVIYYYRLRQLDTDGTANLSPVQSGQIVDGNVVRVGEVHPNPAVKGQGFWIPVQVPEAGAAQLQVYDVQGRLVQTLEQAVEAGRTRLQVSLQDVPAGNYFVKVAVNGRSFYKKLVIQ